MFTYEKLKKWFGEKENKNKLVLGTCFVLVFIVGFGTGNFNKENGTVKNETLNNYNTNVNARATAQVAGQGTTADTNNQNQALDSEKSEDSKEECLIKGNISSSGMIYHVKGGSFYERTNPEMCFNTEAEAQKAGFRKSSR